MYILSDSFASVVISYIWCGC